MAKELKKMEAKTKTKFLLYAQSQTTKNNNFGSGQTKNSLGFLSKYTVSMLVFPPVPVCHFKKKKKKSLYTKRIHYQHT